jgi:mannosyltransferase OCH1-like enzyme
MRLILIQMFCINDSSPNFSRLAESWKRSNWEYRFYDDDQAANFISLHFPKEVKEAYDALIPGAFKADLFRYCVLFIYGGVYADVDVLLETNLDHALDRDVGFFVPLDSPGEESGHQICLWNGFMASAPGHPFLAAAIETVVNNIRNRFTSVDVMNSMCPGEIDFYVSHRYDILMTSKSLFVVYYLCSN